MGHADLRFYGALRAFLANNNRQSGSITHAFAVPGSVKDAIEACGPPHTEVGLVLINGESVDFSERISDGDRISVYPVFRSLDVSTVTRVQPPELRELRFVADGHLRKLAHYLRLLGFDTICDDARSDREMVATSIAEERVLLTRDVGLLKHGALAHGHYVRATEPRRQLLEIAGRYPLSGHLDPFTRCMRCNEGLVQVEKAQVIDRIPFSTRHHIDECWQCSGCGNLYWKGSHYPQLREIVDQIRSAG